MAIDLPGLPAQLTSVSCKPGSLPQRALTRAQVEKLWARDRAALARCGHSLNGLVAFYGDLSSRLEANK